MTGKTGFYGRGLVVGLYKCICMYVRTYLYCTVVGLQGMDEPLPSLFSALRSSVLRTIRTLYSNDMPAALVSSCPQLVMPLGGWNILRHDMAGVPDGPWGHVALYYVGMYVCMYVLYYVVYTQIQICN